MFPTYCFAADIAKLITFLRSNDILTAALNLTENVSKNKRVTLRSQKKRLTFGKKFYLLVENEFNE